MPLHNPFGRYQPKKKGPAFGGEFNAWEPIPAYVAEEQWAAPNWIGPELPTIPTKTHTPPMVPLERLFGDLLKRVWAKAEKPIGLQRDNMLARTRQGKTAAIPYAAMVSPTSAAPDFLGKFPADQTMHLSGLASDWGLHEQLDRFTGYSFRGDSRDPSRIKAAGGFNPPSTRNDDAYIKGGIYEQFCLYMQQRFDKDLKAAMTPDQFLAVVRESVQSPAAKETLLFYSAWRAVVKTEQFHLGRMLAEEALKSYISTTKAVSVAKSFACKNKKEPGWVYCVAVLGGFVVPAKGKMQWTHIYGEQEIAVPGRILWNAVAAARAVRNDMFEGDIFIRNDFDKIDPKPFEQIYKLLSGKKQG
jgi:hypothetical protein